VLSFNENAPARGCWTTFERKYHITILELLAVHKNLLTFLANCAAVECVFTKTIKPSCTYSGRRPVGAR
jgi:hypothetical protein